MQASTGKISYICDRSIDQHLNKIEQISDRSTLVNHLVYVYDLHKRMTMLNVSPAVDEELLSFHSTDYIDNLKTLNNAEDLEKCEDSVEEYGFGYDCPLISGIYDFVRAVVGSSITAARSLMNGSARIAINWYGGWHHAQRDEAKGFCYANDIVCAIAVLRQKFHRVLYIDLDIHHGDGVENAFAFSRNVLTFSLHKYEVGFYPGSGALSDVGCGLGKFYSVNVPFKDGIRDEPYCRTFDKISNMLMQNFGPDAIVMQCGCDSLIGDPLGTFNLTLEGFGHCVKTVLSWKKPTLFLGGGGYNTTNAARCWTYLTSLIVGCDISFDIPEHKYLLKYGPAFELTITRGNRPDCNSDEHLEDVINTIIENTSRIKRSCLS